LCGENESLFSQRQESGYQPISTKIKYRLLYTIDCLWNHFQRRFSRIVNQS